MEKLCLGFLTFALIGTLIPDTLRAAAGDLYVVDLGSDAVVKLNPAGGATTFASGINGGGVAFDSKGNVYVSEPATSTVFKFTPGGVKSVFASTITGAPLGLAFDGAGNLCGKFYVDNQDRSRWSKNAFRFRAKQSGWPGL
jgi:DNA-binding beta-propeller fold protein YncE